MVFFIILWKPSTWEKSGSQVMVQNIFIQSNYRIFQNLISAKAIWDIKLMCSMKVDIRKGCKMIQNLMLILVKCA